MANSMMCCANMMKSMNCMSRFGRKVANDIVKNRRLPTICFTVPTPIRFAFCCPGSFFKSPNPDKRDEKQREFLLDFDCKPTNGMVIFGVCLIDAETLREYSPCGGDYSLIGFSFQLSNVMQIEHGILLEKNASSATVDDVHSKAMPRLYSLSHPLNDICPILMKTLNGHTSFIADADESNLVMIFDGKIGKHISCKLRKATPDEKQKVDVSIENDIFASDMNLDLHSSNSVRFDGSAFSFKQKISPIWNRSSLDASSLHASKLLNMTSTAQSLQTKLGLSFDKSQMQSPYDRLQSSSILAKDAICISSLKVIAILAHCGSLILYIGSVLIGKVDINGISPIRQPQSGQAAHYTFPRRSSLLLTVSNESSFDDEFYSLSPVYSLHLRSNSSNTACLNLQDVCGNRITLQYTNDTMYRIALPPLTECPLVTECLVVLQTMLKRDMATSIITKWYSLRNTGGSMDISYEYEWNMFHNYPLNAMGRTMNTQTKLIQMKLEQLNKISSNLLCFQI